MKKGLLLAAALGAVMVSGCNIFNCNAPKKDGKAVEVKETKKVEAKEAKADH